MASINPFIHFNGNAEEAFTFYQSIFGGAFAKLARYKDISSDEFPIPESDANRIMHISLSIGNHSFLQGSDVMSMMGKVTEDDNRNTISVSAESREDADKIFQGLAEDGAVEMPISDGPTGSYFGMVTDKFGVQWMVDFSS